MYSIIQFLFWFEPHSKAGRSNVTQSQTEIQTQDMRCWISHHTRVPVRRKGHASCTLELKNSSIFLIFSSGVMSKNPDSDPGYEVLNITSDPGSESKSHPEEKAIRWKWSILVYFLIFSCVTAAMLKYLDSDPGYEVLNITVAPWVRSQILRQWSLRSLWEMFAFKKMFVLKVPALNIVCPQCPQSGWIWSALLSYLHCTL